MNGEEHMEDRRLSEIIATAIQREEEAYVFYMDLSGKVNDTSVTETIEWIANEELKHKEKMEYLYANTAFPQTDGG